MRLRIAGLAVVAGLALSPTDVQAGDRAAAPSSASRTGVVSSAAPEASTAGAAILRAGGNAVDAAVATAFALAVVYPQAGNLAGGGFLVLRTASGEEHALDFRETAPAGTWSGSFLGPGGSIRETASTASGLAVGTPGTVRGLEELHRRFGKLPWRVVVAPAIALAREGFVVPEKLSRDLAAERPLLTRSAPTRTLFFPGGRPLAPGTRLRQPDLAATLDAIAAGGARAFHEGPIAERIAAAVQQDGGTLSVHDLEGYAPVWRAPFVVEHEGWRLVTMPPPSSGGFLLESILGQLRAAPSGWRAPSALAMHLIAEAERRAFADRNAFLGDPACVEIPLAQLLAPRRIASLGALIDPLHASRSTDVPGGAEREETTHLSVATADGAAVSLTYTLNGSFGNGAIVSRLGVLLNNEMDDFAIAPGRPNLYGLVQGATNAVRAGARPLSSMTPAIVLRDGKPRLVLGSPGGSTIPTTVLQVFLAAGPRGVPLAQAVSAPRFHHQHLPDQVFVESGGFPAEVTDALSRLGHAVIERGPIGLVHAIAFEPDGTLRGVADPRGYGRAVSVEDVSGASPRTGAAAGAPAVKPL